MHAANVSSPRYRQTRVQPSGCSKQNLHSHLKVNYLTSRVPKFVVDHTIEMTPVGDAASRVAAAMVSKLSINAAANVIELFVQTLFVLQTSPILDSGLVT
ncbi:hypothetical protein TNCV_1825361 [Trichonephila clavipes]|nr:hypothetical protein TNCV_1825361 [Trichonephila clavipes]